MGEPPEAVVNRHRAGLVVKTMLLLGSVAGAGLSLIAFVVGFVATAGCYVDCPRSGPQHHWAAGAVVWGISLLLLVGAPLLASWRIRTRGWITLCSIAPVTVVAFVLIEILTN